MLQLSAKRRKKGRGHEVVTIMPVTFVFQRSAAEWVLKVPRKDLTAQNVSSDQCGLCVVIGWGRKYCFFVCAARTKMDKAVISRDLSVILKLKMLHVNTVAGNFYFDLGCESSSMYTFNVMLG